MTRGQVHPRSSRTRSARSVTPERHNAVTAPVEVDLPCDPTQIDHTAVVSERSSTPSALAIAAGDSVTFRFDGELTIDKVADAFSPLEHLGDADKVERPLRERHDET